MTQHSHRAYIVDKKIPGSQQITTPLCAACFDHISEHNRLCLCIGETVFFYLITRFCSLNVSERCWLWKEDSYGEKNGPSTSRDNRWIEKARHLLHHRPASWRLR